jgi:hypothetical protein
VFAPAAGAIAAWVAKHAPGVDLSADELTNIFIAGALVALAPAVQWLHGWQKYEAREAHKEEVVEVASVAAAAGQEAALPPEDSEVVDEYDDFDDVDEFGDVDESDEELFADEQLTGTRD